MFAGAVIDLETGIVYPPPLGADGEGWKRWNSCSSAYEGSGYENSVNSRLIIVRCGLNIDSNGKNRPDAHYFLWEGTRFREIRLIRDQVPPPQ